MAQAKKKSKKTRILESLQAQLAVKGNYLEHYNDLLKDYIALWETKNLLIKDIKKRGVVYTDVSAAGHEMMKNNPSVKELVAVNRQMLTILKELKLTTDEMVGEDDEL